MDNKPMANMAEGVEADEMSKGPPPEYAPESDTRPLIVAEQHPQPLGPRPFGNIQAHQSNMVVVTSQPITTAVYRPDAPAWVGSDALVYFSIFTMLCCGLIPGLVALFLSWEARNKRDLGEIQEARGYSIAAILCNVFTILLSVGALIGACIYAGIVVSNARSYYDPYSGYN